MNIHSITFQISSLAVTETALFSPMFSDSKIRFRKEKNYLKYDESYLIVCKENRYLYLGEKIPAVLV